MLRQILLELAMDVFTFIKKCYKKQGGFNYEVQR